MQDFGKFSDNSFMYDLDDYHHDYSKCFTYYGAIILFVLSHRYDCDDDDTTYSIVVYTNLIRDLATLGRCTEHMIDRVKDETDEDFYARAEEMIDDIFYSGNAEWLY